MYNLAGRNTAVVSRPPRGTIVPLRPGTNGSPLPVIDRYVPRSVSIGLIRPRRAHAASGQSAEVSGDSRMDRFKPDQPDRGHRLDPAGTTGGIEYLEDRTRPLVSQRGASRTVSLPAVIAGAFLITAVAFGAGFRPAAPANAEGAAGQAAATAPADAAVGPGSALAGNGGTSTGSGKNPGGDAQPEIETTTGGTTADSTPKAEPTRAAPTEAPVADPILMPLKLRLDGTKVSVKWGGCTIPDFWAYKVVRSSDEAATWPMGKRDTLVAAIENPATLSFVDTGLTAGSAYSYKVVALTRSGGEAILACRTETGRIGLPAPKPTTAPSTGGGGFTLAVSTVESKVVIDWTACSAPGFDYYKVVRSKDSNVSFPGDGNDSVIAAVGPDGDTIAYEKGLPAGITVYYAVFCVDKTGAGYAVLAATSVKSITTPASAPKPTPKPAPPVSTMGFNVQSTADGVVLTWEACGSDGFVYYKVVRAQHGNPSYFPWTDGSEVIAVIENSGVTTFVDHPPAGGTWHYRIQAIGTWDGQKVLLGQTPALSVAL